MDSHPFAKFGQDKYLLHIHSNGLLRTIFQKLWFPFVVLILVTLGAIVGSIIAAGDFRSVIATTVRMFLGADEYCDSSLSHAAACLIDLGGLVFLPFLVVLAIVGFMVSGLSKEVPRVLFEIAALGRIKYSGETNHPEKEASREEIDDRERWAVVWRNAKERYRIRPRNSLTYVEDFESALVSPWRYVFFGFWLLLGYVIAIQMMKEVGLEYADLPILIIAGYVFEIIVPIFVAYFVAAWMWFYFIVGYYLQWLPRLFKLDINPNHGDNCGGLKRLGDICFKMALSIILPAILLGAWGVTGIVWMVSVNIPTFAFFLFIVIIILMLLAFWAFFYPLISIHVAMAETKDQTQEERAAKITEIESRLRMLYEQGNYEGKEVRLLLKQLELAQTIYPADVRFPTWPFSTPVLLGFFTTQIVPVVGAVKLIGDFAGLFE